MLDLKELWVGDTVRIISSGKVGSFEGIHKTGKARVKSSEKIYLISPSNLELHDAKDEELPFNFEENSPATASIGITFFEDFIDLHIEKLNESLINGLPERIIDFQTKAFLAYLQQAKDNKKSIVTIIHGKGAGVLKLVVHSTLKSEESVFSFREVNNGGATEVVFNPNY